MLHLKTNDKDYIQRNHFLIITVVVYVCVWRQMSCCDNQLMRLICQLTIRSLPVSVDENMFFSIYLFFAYKSKVQNKRIIWFYHLIIRPPPAPVSLLDSWHLIFCNFFALKEFGKKLRNYNYSNILIVTVL